MKFLHQNKKIIFVFVTFLTISFPCHSQALWELGAKVGEVYCLGDANKKIFNAFQLGYGGYLRWIPNPRWNTKLQVVVGDIKKPIEQMYFDVSVQEEFNFFEFFGVMNSRHWSRFFTPYLTAGIGLCGYHDDRDRLNYTFEIPFGFGVKCKVAPIMTIGIEWTMTKLFVDDFDKVDNPYQFSEKTLFVGKDWNSMLSLNVGFDIGWRRGYCR